MITILAPLLLGAGVVRAIGLRWRDDRWAWIAWCWLAGSFGMGVLLCLWMGLGLRWHPLAIAAIAAGSGVALAFVRRKCAEPLPPAATRRPFPLLERLLLACVVLIALARLADTFWAFHTIPMILGDETAIWAAKAKSLYAGQGFGERLRMLLSPQSGVAHADYPILNPLLQVWAFAQSGGITYASNRLPIQAMAPALILAAAGALRHRLRPALAAAFLLLILGLHRTLLEAMWAESDIMMAFGVLVATDAWMRFEERGERRWWWLVCLALAFALWTKHEGAMVAACFALAALLALITARGRLRQFLATQPTALLGLALPLAVLAFTWTFNSSFGLHNDLLGDNPRSAGLLALLFEQFGERALAVLDYFAREVYLDPERSRLLVPAFFALILLQPRRLAHGPWPVPTLALLLALFGYQLVLIGSFADLSYHLSTAAERITYHLLPATALWLGAFTADIFPATRCEQA